MKEINKKKKLTVILIVKKDLSFFVNKLKPRYNIVICENVSDISTITEKDIIVVDQERIHELASFSTHIAVKQIEENLALANSSLSGELEDLKNIINTYAKERKQKNKTVLKLLRISLMILLVTSVFYISKLISKNAVSMTTVTAIFAFLIERFILDKKNSESVTENKP